MSSKFLLCLALILGVSLCGCSSFNGALNESAEGALFSNHDAICLKSDDRMRPWILRDALTEYTVNEKQLFITVHSRGEVDSDEDISKWQPEYTTGIYVKTGGQFKLLKRLSTDGLSYFLRPAIFPTPIERPGVKDDWEQLIQITEVCYGTEGLTQEHIFTAVALPVSDLKIDPEIAVEPVDFTPAWESYHFGKGESLWKNEWNKLSGERMSYGFLVWKSENGNFHPVDKVTGTYRLEDKPDGGLRIVVDTQTHESVKDADWH